MNIFKRLSQQSPFLKLLYIFILQLVVILTIDWLNVRNEYDTSKLDSVIWGILFPAGIFFSALIFYKSSPFDGLKRWLALPIQIVVHTLASWGLIIVALLYFHDWIGGTF